MRKGQNNHILFKMTYFFCLESLFRHVREPFKHTFHVAMSFSPPGTYRQTNNRSVWMRSDIVQAWTIQRSLSSSTAADKIKLSSMQSSQSESETELEIKSMQERKKEKKKIRARDKRREFIGMAKAVDRGQWPNIYNPGGADGKSFVAKSNLPDRTKPFLVLGIESSCDDTGGTFVFF